MKNNNLRLLGGISLGLSSILFFCFLWLDEESTNQKLHATLVYALMLLAGGWMAWRTNFGHRRIRILFAVAAFAPGIVLAVQWTISIACLYFFNGPLNRYQAWSILVSPKQEILSMATMFAPFIIILPLLFSLYYFNIRYIGNQLGGKKSLHRWIIGLAIYFVLGIVYTDWAMGSRHRQVESLTAEVLRKTPLYNFAEFFEAAKGQQYLASMENLTYKHSVHHKNNGFKHIVVVIGESARRDHHEIYDYRRETTPYMVKNREKMIVFENAIAPAAYTLIAVPLSLTTAAMYPDDSGRMVDSVLRLAKQDNYHVVWISSQAAKPHEASTVTALAKQADQAIWTTGFDENVLPHVASALQRTGKNLIFVHLSGSHEPVCNGSPIDQRIFTKPNDSNNEDDCYDDSIAYTDRVLGRIFDLMKKDGAMLYYSDHALVKSRGRYTHNQGPYAVESTEALEIPMWLWFANGRPKDLPDIINSSYQTSLNYWLIADLMGLTVDGDICRSALAKCHFDADPKMM